MVTASHRLVNRIGLAQRNFSEKIRRPSRMPYSDRFLALGLESFENCHAKFDLTYCYKITHALVNLKIDDFSAWRIPLPDSIITNERSSTPLLMLAKKTQITFFQTV